MASSSEEEDIDDIEEEEEEETGNRVSGGGGGGELERIQSECSAMVQLLINLEKEEHQLNCQLEILAREALLCGFSPEVVEPPAPKRRRIATPTSAGKKKDE